MFYIEVTFCCWIYIDHFKKTMLKTFVLGKSPKNIEKCFFFLYFRILIKKVYPKSMLQLCLYILLSGKTIIFTNTSSYQEALYLEIYVMAQFHKIKSIFNDYDSQKNIVDMFRIYGPSFNHSTLYVSIIKQNRHILFISAI